jgi:hypothetical protein
LHYQTLARCTVGALIPSVRRLCVVAELQNRSPLSLDWDVHMSTTAPQHQTSTSSHDLLPAARGSYGDVSACTSSCFLNSAMMKFPSTSLALALSFFSVVTCNWGPVYAQPQSRLTAGKSLILRHNRITPIVELIRLGLWFLRRGVIHSFGEPLCALGDPLRYVEPPILPKA